MITCNKEEDCFLRDTILCMFGPWDTILCMFGPWDTIPGIT